MHLLQVIKAGSGRSRNEAVKVGTLTLFQDGVKLLSWSDYTASLVHTKTLSHVNNIACHMSSIVLNMVTDSLIIPWLVFCIEGFHMMYHFK